MANSAQNWLKLAEEDLLWSRASFREGIWRGVCFTAQQSAEKALKAYLLSQHATVPRIHDLVALNEQCRQLLSEFHALAEACSVLSPYYLSSRYPDLAEFEDYSEGMSKNALLQAERVFEFVKSRI